MTTNPEGHRQFPVPPPVPQMTSGRSTAPPFPMPPAANQQPPVFPTPPAYPAPPPVPAPTPAAPTVAASGQVASVGARAGAYIIDALCTLLVGPLILVPVIGNFLIGLALLAYWLLRDVGGASIGKLLLGLEVRNADGTESTTGARLLRNITLVVGWALFALPLIGFLLGTPVILLMVLAEIIMLLATGNRLGDRLGKTIVVRK